MESGQESRYSKGRSHGEVRTGITVKSGQESRRSHGGVKAGVTVESRRSQGGVTVESGQESR